MHPEIVRNMRDRAIALQRDPHRPLHHLVRELLRSSHGSGSLSARTSSWPQGLRRTRDGSLVDVLLLAGFALAAGVGALSRAVRSIAGSTGLVTCSALLVHIWGGTIEAHFHFFVVVSLLMLYQDWVPFLIAIDYVVVHHGLVGALAPESVYSHAGAQARPWLWALVHGGFVLASATANLVSWRANEQLLRDPLTGLPSRLVLHNRLWVALERARRQGTAVAVLFIDIDRFKVLNDSRGHDTGDQVLRVVSERLRSGARRADLVVRFGGDEFIVVCEDLDGPTAALATAERFGALLRMPVRSTAGRTC
jgi:diguanylate cyclase